MSTNADKERSVRAALGHARAGKMSDHAIADHCGVSAAYVGKMRPASINGLQIAEREVTRNGKTYTQDTANIGKMRALTSNGLQSDRTGRDGRTIDTAKISKARKASHAPQGPRTTRQGYLAGRQGTIYVQVALGDPPGTKGTPKPKREATPKGTAPLPTNVSFA